MRHDTLFLPNTRGCQQLKMSYFSEIKGPESSTYQEPLKKLVSPADTSDVSMEFCTLQQKLHLHRRLWGVCVCACVCKCVFYSLVPRVQLSLVGRWRQHQRRRPSRRHLSREKHHFCLFYFPSKVWKYLCREITRQLYNGKTLSPGRCSARHPPFSLLLQIAFNYSSL